MGFYVLPPETQLDLLAYHRVVNDSEDQFRWSSHGPARLADLALHGLRSGVVEVLSGLRAWLGANGVRFRAPDRGKARSLVTQAKRALHMRNAKRCGASQRAVSFWLGD